MSGAATTGAAARTRRLWHGVVWYLREVTGEADYERYVRWHRLVHPDEPAPTRREFDLLRSAGDADGTNPRCC